MLGTPLMPWQRHVADVALEVDPHTGRLVYREVVLTVPRQSGKTTLILALAVHRALGFDGPQRINYTAQTRLDARRKWEDEHVRALRASPLAKMFTVRRQIGQEAIRWRNGSMHGITSTTEKAGHGETLDLGVIDEAFAHEDSRLEQAMRPAMITRPQPQLWVVSTAGTARSVFLRAKVDEGRLRCTTGSHDGTVAYFEWSAPPEAPWDDPATWRACMPALGHTVTEAAIAAELSMGGPEFRRAYLNQWPDAAPAGWLVITEANWTALVDRASQIDGSLVFAADITPDRSHGCIGASGLRRDGNRHVEVVDHRRGTGWMLERAIDLNQRHRPIGWVIDGAGPAGSLIAPLEQAGLNVIVPTTREVAQWCGQFYDLTDPTNSGGTSVRHLDQAPLNVAVAGAVKRPLGDAWAWARKGGTDISPLVTVTLAAGGHASHPPGKPAPVPLAAWA